MSIEFASPPPKRWGGTTVNMEFVTKLFRALEGNPGEWAKVSYGDFYPGAGAIPNSKLRGRLSNLASKIKRGDRPFDKYQLEVTVRGNDIYVRIREEEIKENS